MFDDLIKKEQDYLYKVYDYGTIFVDFQKKIIEFKGDFREIDLQLFSILMNIKYDIMDEILYSGKWKWIENEGKMKEIKNEV